MQQLFDEVDCQKYCFWFVHTWDAHCYVSRALLIAAETVTELSKHGADVLICPVGEIVMFDDFRVYYSLFEAF